MPKNGTAMNTQIANAAVVDSEPVGGWEPGMTVPILAEAMNRKSVPRKVRYLSGFSSPTAEICFTMLVTMISRAACHRETVPASASRRVINLAANDITII